jgi:hypothetical protein
VKVFLRRGITCDDNYLTQQDITGYKERGFNACLFFLGIPFLPSRRRREKIFLTFRIIFFFISSFDTENKYFCSNTKRPFVVEENRHSLDYLFCCWEIIFGPYVNFRLSLSAYGGFFSLYAIFNMFWFYRLCRYNFAIKRTTKTNKIKNCQWKICHPR